MLSVGLLGGLYPAFYLTRFQPAQVLKANKSAAVSAGSGRLHNILVIGQFSVSIGLIVCTAIVNAQTRYTRSADAGFVRSGLIQSPTCRGRRCSPRARRWSRRSDKLPARDPRR